MLQRKPCSPSSVNIVPPTSKPCGRSTRLALREGFPTHGVSWLFTSGANTRSRWWGSLAGKSLGFVVVDHDSHGQGHVITIDVLPEARRSGLGSRLMAAAEERLRTLECSAVFLEAAVDNAAALAFYQRHGYRVLQTIPRYYLDSIDALVLVKDLRP